MRRLRIALWLLVAIAAIGYAILLVRAPDEAALPEASVRADPAQPISIGGPFTLVDGEGETFSSTKLSGRPYAIFFGFTHCPDVCPTTLAELVRLREAVGGEEAFDIVFVTVDPARDGPEEMARYTGLFGTPIIGLTGSEAQVEKAMEQFGVAAIVDEQSDPEAYDVNHTASVFLVDRQGRFEATIAPEESEDAARAKLERLIG